MRGWFLVGAILLLSLVPAVAAQPGDPAGHPKELSCGLADYHEGGGQYTICLLGKEYSTGEICDQFACP